MATFRLGEVDSLSIHDFYWNNQWLFIFMNANANANVFVCVRESA